MNGPVKTHPDEPLGQIEVAGAIAGALWFGVLLFWWLSQPEGQGPGLLMTAFLMVLPLAMIVGLVSSLRSVRLLRAEAERLRMALDVQRQNAPPRPSAVRAPPQPAPPPEEQTVFALDVPEPSQLTIADYIVAMNFPDSEDDAEGINALNLALADHDTAKVIRAAQDVLTLLSQDGVFMDDLASEPAPAEAWRRFGAGERGPSVAQLGGVTDRNVLNIVGQRMRDDQIFRDAAHHFLRAFDRSVSGFIRAATDTELEWFGQTRTSRAFMLLGRATGTFD